MNNLKITKGFTREVSLFQMSELAEGFLLFVKNNFEKELSERSIFVSLSGNLGAGKTTFSKEIATKLGIGDNVTSPTFVIQKTYQTVDTEIKQFIHLDAYRLEESKELSNIGFDKTLVQPKTLIFLEWPEKVPEYALKSDLKIEFSVVSEDKRKVIIS